MPDAANHPFMLGFRYRGRQLSDDGFSSWHIIFEVESRDPALAATHQRRDPNILAVMLKSSITSTHIARYSSSL
jgi:hypothetical protein